MLHHLIVRDKPPYPLVEGVEAGGRGSWRNGKTRAKGKDPFAMHVTWEQQRAMIASIRMERRGEES
jgi:hypothetical protein